MSIHLRLNAPAWNKNIIKTNGKESSTLSSSAGYHQILHTISSLKEQKSHHCLCPLLSCTNESYKRQRSSTDTPSPPLHQPVLVVKGTRLLVNIFHRTEKRSQSVNPRLQTLACSERLGSTDQPEEFALSRLRCIVCLFCVDIKQRGLP